MIADKADSFLSAKSAIICVHLRETKQYFMQKITFIFFLFLQTFLFAQESVVLGIQDRHFQQLGMNKSQIEIWEDGMRTSGDKNTFEWWYFDAILADSSKIVIVFYTKPMHKVALANPNPCITVSITKKNGFNFKNYYQIPLAECHFAKEKCEVIMGKSYVKGDLKRYEIHLDLPDIQANLNLVGEVPAWRPGTGHIFFGEQERHFFAWLPSVPKGKIEGTLRYQNNTEKVSGSGYHDHNWGNQNMYKLMNHWYWSRVDLGEYTVIASQIVAQKRFKYTNTPIFMVAKNGEILADSAIEYMKFAPTQREIEPFTKRPLYKQLIFNYDSPTQDYVLTLHQKEIIEKVQFINILKGLKKKLALLFQINPTYLRISGEATLQVSKGGQTETLKGNSIWEQFYFGKNID